MSNNGVMIYICSCISAYELLYLDYTWHVGIIVLWFRYFFDCEWHVGMSRTRVHVCLLDTNYVNCNGIRYAN